MLKADNKELNKLLTESREDLQALQAEVGEQSIAPPIRGKLSIHVLRVAEVDPSTSRDAIETLSNVEWAVFLCQRLGKRHDSSFTGCLTGVKAV
jgi:hypothetical protein